MSCFLSLLRGAVGVAARVLAMMVIGLLGWPSTPATAQTLGSAFTYQGVLRDAGQPASGAHDFEFVLYAQASGGSPLGGVQTRSAVPLDGGLFTVSLDFGAQFLGSQRWLEVRVRRSGGSAFTTLSPRQLISPVPYAQFADSVAANSIIGANIVSRSITGSSLALQAVGSAELADGAVTTAKLAAAAVTTAKLGPAAVGSGNIAAQAVLAEHVDPTQVQRRISGICSRGTPMLGVAESGAVICDQPQRIGSTGQSLYERVSVVIRTDGRPLVAYTGPTLMDCNDPDCQTWVTRTLPGALAGSGVSLSLRSDGLPVIAYGTDFSNLGLYIYVCSNSACTAGTNTPLDSGLAATFPSLALRADNTPLIAYYHWDSSQARLFVCNLPSCNTGGLIRTLTTGSTPRSLRIRGNGTPVVALRDFNVGQARLYDCNDAGCASGTLRQLGVTPSIRHALSIGVRADNRPLVAGYLQDFSATPANRLVAYSCLDAGCSSVQPQLLGEAVVVGSDTLIRSDGRALIAHLSAAGSQGSLRLWDCANVECSGGTLRVLDLFPASTSQEVSMALRPDGRPVIAYASIEPSELRLLVCRTATCQ